MTKPETAMINKEPRADVKTVSDGDQPFCDVHRDTSFFC